MKWYYDDKVQMLLNTYWPRRPWFWAYWDSETGQWKEGKR